MIRVILIGVAAGLMIGNAAESLYQHHRRRQRHEP